MLSRIREREREREMTIEKNREGAYVISDIVSGYLVTRSYYGYAKRDAVRLFRAYVRGEER